MPNGTEKIEVQTPEVVTPQEATAAEQPQGVQINRRVAGNLFGMLDNQPDVRISTWDDFENSLNNTEKLNEIHRYMLSKNPNFGSFDEFQKVLFTPDPPRTIQEEAERVEARQPSQAEQQFVLDLAINPLTPVDIEKQSEQSTDPVVDAGDIEDADPFKQVAESGVEKPEEETPEINPNNSPIENILNEKFNEFQTDFAVAATTDTSIEIRERERIEQEIKEHKDKVSGIITDTITPKIYELDTDVGRTAMINKLKEQGFNKIEINSAIAEGENLLFEQKVRSLSLVEEESAAERFFGREIELGRDVSGAEVSAKAAEQRIDYVLNELFNSAENKSFELIKEFGELERIPVPSPEVLKRKGEIREELKGVRQSKKDLLDPKTGQLIGTPDEELVKANEAFVADIERVNLGETPRDKLAEEFNRAYLEVRVLQRDFEKEREAFELEGAKIRLIAPSKDRLDNATSKLIEARLNLYSISRAFLLNEDIAGIARNGWKNLVQRAAEGFNIVPKLPLETKSNIDFIQQYSNIASSAGIPLTGEQKERAVNNFGEDLGDALGGFAGITPWLIGMNIATGGVSNALGITRAVGMLRKGGATQKVVAWMIDSAIEEVKLQSLGFAGGVGTGFTTAGRAVEKAGFRFKGKFGSVLSQFMNRSLRGVGGGMGGAELGVSFQSLVQAYREDRDFSETLKENGFLFTKEENEIFAEALAFLAFAHVHSIRGKSTLPNPEKVRSLIPRLREMGKAEDAAILEKMLANNEISKKAEVERTESVKRDAREADVKEGAGSELVAKEQAKAAEVKVEEPVVEPKDIIELTERGFTPEQLKAADAKVIKDIKEKDLKPEQTEIKEGKLVEKVAEPEPKKVVEPEVEKEVPVEERIIEERPTTEDLKKGKDVSIEGEDFEILKKSAKQEGDKPGQTFYDLENKATGEATRAELDKIRVKRELTPEEFKAREEEVAKEKEVKVEEPEVEKPKVSTKVTLLERGFEEKQLAKATEETLNEIVEKKFKPEEVKITEEGGLEKITKVEEPKKEVKITEPERFTARREEVAKKEVEVEKVGVAEKLKLEAKGFTGEEISRMKNTSAERILGENLTPNDVKIDKEGNAKLKPSGADKAGIVKTIEIEEGEPLPIRKEPKAKLSKESQTIASKAKLEDRQVSALNTLQKMINTRNKAEVPIFQFEGKDFEFKTLLDEIFPKNKVTGNQLKLRNQLAKEHADAVSAFKGRQLVRSAEIDIKEAEEAFKVAKADLGEFAVQALAPGARRGIVPFEKANFKAVVDFFDATLNLAKAHAARGMKTVGQFAKAIGEKVTNVLKDIWNRAISSLNRDTPKMSIKNDFNLDKVEQEDFTSVIKKIRDKKLDSVDDIINELETAAFSYELSAQHNPNFKLQYENIGGALRNMAEMIKGDGSLTGSNDILNLKVNKDIPEALAKGKRAEIFKGNETAEEVESVYQRQRQELEESNKSSSSNFFTRMRQGFIKSFEDVSGNLKEKLWNAGAMDAIVKKELLAGSSKRATEEFLETEKEAFGGLSREEYGLLADYIQNRSTIEIHTIDDALKRERTKRPEGTKEQAQKWLGTLEGVDPELFKKLDNKANIYFNKLQQLLVKRLEGGVITQELFDKLKENVRYSPSLYLEHLVNEAGTLGFEGNKISVSKSDIKKRSGGSEKSLFNDPRYLLQNSILSVDKLVAKNEANQTLHKFAVENPGNGIVEAEKPIRLTKTGKPVFGKASLGFERVNVLIEGKNQSMLMPTDLAKQWTQGEFIVNQNAANVMRVASGGFILRPMATGINPAFALSNIPRDIAHVLMVTDVYSPHFPVAIKQMATDISQVSKDAISRTGRYNEYIKEGGGMEFLTHQGRSFKGSVVPKTDVGKGIKSFMHYLGYMNETSEIMVRLAIRERSIKKQVKNFIEENGIEPTTEEVAKIKEMATWESRTQMDFSQGGKWAKYIDQFLPYTNASIQGTRALARSARLRPKEFAYKFAQLGAFSTAVYLNNMNTEGFSDIDDGIKSRNFIFMIPYKTKDDLGRTIHHYVKIPKSPDQIALSGMFEDLSHWISTGELPRKKLVADLESAIPTMPFFEDIPPFMAAIETYKSNWDDFRNQEVWKGQRVENWAEFYNGTPQFYKDIGKTFDISPVRLEAAVGKVTTMLRFNMYGVIADKAYNEIRGVVTDEERDDIDKSLLENADDIAGTVYRRFKGQTNPSAGVEKLERYSIEENTRRLTQNRKVQDFIVGIDKGKKTETDFDIWVQKQDEVDRDRLNSLFETRQKNKDVDYWFVQLAHLPSPEVKARAFYERYKDAGKEEQESMLDSIRKVGGIVTQRFVDKISVLSDNKLKISAPTRRGRRGGR
jgi:hypothetical protein